MKGEVLVVDDDPIIRDTLVDVVADEGFAPISAGNGLEALSCIRGGLRPRLVLLDLMMPVMDGWAFLEAVRGDPALADLRIAILSASDASSFPPSVPRALRIRKPFGLDEVLRVLSALGA